MVMDERESLLERARDGAPRTADCRFQRRISATKPTKCRAKPLIMRGLPRDPEAAGSTEMGGGSIRTQTACQARSRFRTTLRRRSWNKHRAKGADAPCSTNSARRLASQPRWRLSAGESSTRDCDCSKRISGGRRHPDTRGGGRESLSRAHSARTSTGGRACTACYSRLTR